MASLVFDITPAPASIPTIRPPNSAFFASRSVRLVTSASSGTIRPIFASVKLAPRSTTLDLKFSQYAPCVTGSHADRVASSTPRATPCHITGCHRHELHGIPQLLLDNL